MDSSNDPGLSSWLESANDPATDFPVQNLPYGRFRTTHAGPLRIGIAIGDQVLDLRRAGLIGGDDLNALMASPPQVLRQLRQRVSQGLRNGSDQARAFRASLLPLSGVSLDLPCHIGDYTDFYSSIHHATNVGRQFRPDQPLLPNYKWVPIGYHGRTSSIGASGQQVQRPCGQVMEPGVGVPRLAASRKLDFEMELGLVVSRANEPGCPIPLADAEQHVFGLLLLNDWSARDIQSWEYQPLGPFLSKNFATTISPWIVTMAALSPFRMPIVRPATDPPPLPYLDGAHNRAFGAIGIQLEVWLQTAAMRAVGEPGARLAGCNYQDAYWSIAQLVAHHTVGGCNLRSGDLMGTGTLSGPGPEEAGSLLELSLGGRRQVPLPNGELRTFLEDGDQVTLRAWCERPGYRRIGFGECIGIVVPGKPCEGDLPPG